METIHYVIIMGSLQHFKLHRLVHYRLIWSSKYMKNTRAKAIWGPDM